MNILTALYSLFALFFSKPVQEIPTTPIQRTSVQVQVYPYGGYYSYPPYCPPGYSYGPGAGYYNRGFSLYFGPRYGYPGCYYGPGYYYPRGPGRYYYYGHKRRHR